MKRIFLVFACLFLLASSASAGIEFENYSTISGLTFFKDYTNSPNSLDADWSVGNGEATFTRTACNATYIDANGTIQLVTTANQPRFPKSYYDATGRHDCDGLLIEAAATNLLSDSYFSQTLATYWRNTATGGTVSQSSDVANIYGGGTVGKLVADTTDMGFRTTVANKPVLAASTVYTISAIVSGSGKVAVYSESNNGGTLNYGTELTLTTTPVLISKTFTQAAATTGENCGIVLRSNTATTCYIHALQIEAGPYPTSFIPTTTASATRNAETLKYYISGNRTASQETISIQFMPLGGNFANDGASRYLLDNEGSGRRLLYKGDAIATAIFDANLDNTTTVASNNILLNTLYVLSCVAVSTGNPNRVIYQDGSSVNLSNTDFTANNWSGSFTVGSRYNSINQINGLIKGIHIYSRNLSSTEISSDENLFGN